MDSFSIVKYNQASWSENHRCYEETSPPVSSVYNDDIKTFRSHNLSGILYILNYFRTAKFLSWHFCFLPNNAMMNSGRFRFSVLGVSLTGALGRFSDLWIFLCIDRFFDMLVCFFWGTSVCVTIEIFRSMLNPVFRAVHSVYLGGSVLGFLLAALS